MAWLVGLTGKRFRRYRIGPAPVKVVIRAGSRATIENSTVQSGFGRRSGTVVGTLSSAHASTVAVRCRLLVRLLVRNGSQRFTVMLIPHSERRTYNLQLSLFTLLFFGTMLILVLSAFLVLSTHFTATNERMAAVNRSLVVSEQELEAVGDEVIGLQETAQEFRVLLEQLHRMLHSENLIASTGSGEGGERELGTLVSQPTLSSDESPDVTTLRQLSAALDAAMTPLAELSDTLAAQRTLLVDVPTLWPVRGGGGYVTFQFGPQRHPFRGVFYIHRGIDIAMHRGAEVVATANGTVRRVAYERYNLGNMIEIEHRYGFVTRYGHLDRTFIEAGQTVQRGQVIGLMGSTGLSTGSHVHYEVSIGGQLRNPSEFLTTSEIAAAASR